MTVLYKIKPSPDAEINRDHLDEDGYITAHRVNDDLYIVEDIDDDYGIPDLGTAIKKEDIVEIIPIVS